MLGLTDFVTRPQSRARHTTTIPASNNTYSANTTTKFLPPGMTHMGQLCRGAVWFSSCLLGMVQIEATQPDSMAAHSCKE